MNSIDSFISFPLSQPVAIFLLVLAIILFSPIVFDRLRIPRIVGLIVAGVVVGPYCLNLLAYDASFKIFGEVGILYLMFLAAVEIDMYHLKKNIRKGLFFGLLTFILPMVGGLLISKYVFNVGWDTAALLAVMYSAHTLVSYPTVSRFGLSDNKGVVIAVAGTIVAVLLALLVLAEVVTVRTMGSFGWSELGYITGFSIIYGLIIFFTFPAIAKYFFRKYNDSVAQFIFILAMIFVSSLLAQLIGLEPILGAFFGGLVLNKFVPARSSLMNHITFVGNAIFIPYFLIGVGMIMNIGVLFNGWDVLLLALIMAATALVTKWIAMFITRKTYRLSGAEGTVIFGLSSGKAAATIAATMIGFQYGMLSESLMNGAVVMILICCIVATVTTERAAKKIRIQLNDETIEDNLAKRPKFARQLVAVANPITAEGITRLAAFMRSPKNDEPITLLFVRSNDDHRMIKTGRNALEIAKNAAQAMHIEAHEMVRYDFNIVTGLTNTLKEKDCTDIIIGLHRKSNIVDSFFGSITEQLIKATYRMVVLSRCFVPVDTVNKIYVFAPHNAEYETGFQEWVSRIANLAAQIGRRVIFMAGEKTAAFIEEYIVEQKYGFGRKYLDMETWDDFIVQSNLIAEDDLFIVIAARKGSLSHTGELENMPGYLSKHFMRNNIAVVYPSQFNG